MIGIGAQDNLDAAQRFVTQTGITFTMLWDPTFDSWNYYEILSNSDLQVLDRSGDRVGDLIHGFSPERVEEEMADA